MGMGLGGIGRLGRLGRPAPSKGGGVPAGFGYMVDETGANLLDETGAYLIGQSAPAYSTIKDAATARGIRFGVASNPTALTAAGSLIAQQFSILGWTSAFTGSNIQATQGVFTWTAVDAALSYAASVSLPWTLSFLIYPAHDMPWVSGATVTAGTWQGLVDSHFEAVAAHLATLGNGTPALINVTNELADGSEANGFKRNTWYNAGGRAAFAYMFTKARALWPTVPLYLTQDLLEEVVPSYGDRRVAFLQIVDYLQSVGAPVDGVNIQGHISPNRTWDAAAFRTYLGEIRSRGLKIIVGEHDVHVDPNLSGPFAADYSTAALDAAVAYRSALYADIILPYVDGGSFMMWDLKDSDNFWGAEQRPCLYDASLAVKPAFYSALLEPFLTRR